MPFSLCSQCALITGASRGLGEAIALRLASQGAWVAGTATTEEGAKLFTRKLTSLNLKGQGYVLDLSNFDSVKACFTKLRKINRLPSILINNAGITRDGIALNLSQEAWQSVLDVNLSGAFYLIQHCLPPMLKACYGRIINIGSVVGLWGNTGQVSYAAAKAGLIGLSKTLAREVAKKGITVNVVAPGLIQTSMTKELTEAQRMRLLKDIPMERIGLPEEVANACMFLAAQESGYITGHTLHVNGGLWME